MDDYLRDSIPIEKDVEGLCHTYRHNLYHNIRYVDTQSQKYFPRSSSHESAAAPGKKAVEEIPKKCVLPCTPLAIVKILEYLKLYDESLPVGDRMAGKNVTVINRSEIVGRPLAGVIFDLLLKLFFFLGSMGLGQASVRQNMAKLGWKTS